MKRLLALLLVCCLLLTAVPTALADDDGKTDQQLINQFHIANNWARPALLFALHNGLLSGKSETNLAPEDHATRAEVAAILMRILRTQTQADLSSFTDVKQSAWYYPTLAQAAAVGLISGNGKGQMQPNTVITREQAFSLLARAFGVYEGGLEDLYPFSDWFEVSNWAIGSVAALVRCGCVSGSGGKLNPKANISRQELAQVIYSLLAGLGTTIPAEQNGNYALAAQSIAPGTVVHGDLLISGEADTLSLENITVEGRLIIQGCGTVALTICGCSAETLVLCRDTVLTTDGSVGTIEMNADLKLVGNADGITAYGGELTITEGSEAGTVNIRADGTQVRVDGKVGKAELTGKNVCVSGNGMVDSVEISRDGCSVSCGIGSVTENIRSYLEGVSAARIDSSKPTYSNPAVTLRVRFTCSDQSVSREPCRLTWVVNGKIVKVEENVKISNGKEVSCLMNYPDYLSFGESSLPVRLIASSGEQTLTCKMSVDVSNATVRTSRVQATITKNTSMYWEYNDTNDTLVYWICDIPAGTKVNYLNKYCDVARILLQDGKTGWVRLNTVSITPGPDYTTQDYLPEVKEYFVNTVMGYSSSSQYLVWVNIWCQQISIFEGSKGNWKLIRTADCATGKNWTASPIGTHYIRKKTAQQNAGSYYYHHITWMEGTLGLHSRLYNYGGGFYDSTIARPVSNGCIRLYDADCIWIYDNVPVGSTVIIY